MQSQPGDKEIFRTIVEQHGRVLFGTAYLMNHDRGLAEDAVQETFVKAWRYLSSRRVNGSMRAWLVRVVINEVKQQSRKKRLPEVPLEQVPEMSAGMPDVETVLLQNEEQTSLRQAVDMLPPDQKEAVVLRYFAELTVPEVARATGQREGTIKSRLSRAMDRLEQILKKDEITEKEVISWTQKNLSKI